ncbi:phosphotransferase family protein [Mycobacterium sp. 134]|uniref:phosphotransferase family protein n=1 Tax=Mycobacterium sp. 134 TaxID=3400425 RepID=UPI003AAE4940
MTTHRESNTHDVRAEDAIDITQLSRWLIEQDPTLHGAPELHQFSGGASNLTYLLRFPDRDLVLRRPPHGYQAAGSHNIGREHRIQTALQPIFRYVPRTVGLCEDDTVIGAPFYVMERIDGHIPRRRFPVEMALSVPQTRQLCIRTLDVLIQLHQLDISTGELAWLTRGDGYVHRQVQGWSARYRRTKTWNVGSFESVISWLNEHQPGDRGTCLIHNDFRIDNMVYSRAEPTQPIGLLDWELATVGDPLMDLGAALAYWTQRTDPRHFKAFGTQPTDQPGMLTRREVVHHYCTSTGIGLSDDEWCFYEVFGLFRLAVICQQIYYRYHHKQTTNRDFRTLFVAVNLLERRCRILIRRHR